MEPLRRLRVEDVIEVWCAAEVSMRAHAPGLNGLAPSEVIGGHLATLVERVAAATRPATNLTAVSDSIERTLASLGDGPRSARLVGQFLGGIGDLCRNCDELDATRLAMAFEAGVERMHSIATGRDADAVVVIVAAAVAEAALNSADSGRPMAEVLIEAADGGLDALEAQATNDARAAEATADDSMPGSGVDPAAAGLLVVVDAFVAVVHGDDPELPSWEFEPDDDESPAGESFRYEVSLNLDANEEAAAVLAAAWRSLGGDVVVVHDPSESLLHGSVATDDIGAVIEAAVAIGRPSRIVVGDHRP